MSVQRGPLGPHLRAYAMLGPSSCICEVGAMSVQRGPLGHRRLYRCSVVTLPGVLPGSGTQPPPVARPVIKAWALPPAPPVVWLGTEAWALNPGVNP